MAEATLQVENIQIANVCLVGPLAQRRNFLEDVAFMDISMYHSHVVLLSGKIWDREVVASVLSILFSYGKAFLSQICHVTIPYCM